MSQAPIRDGQCFLTVFPALRREEQHRVVLLITRILRLFALSRAKPRLHSAHWPEWAVQRSRGAGDGFR